MRTIHLDGEESLRIFSLPLRQRILREMQKAGVPVTAKQIADRLGITPSSAQHHLKRLQSIGLVEPDHIESINGIQAKFMRVTDVMVSIGQQVQDETSLARDTFMKGHLMEAYSGYQRVVDIARGNPQAQAQTGNDIFTEIAHLTDAEAVELRAMVMEYVRQHKRAGADTKPWQIVYLAYDMELAERGGRE